MKAPLLRYSLLPLLALIPFAPACVETCDDSCSEGAAGIGGTATVDKGPGAGGGTAPAAGGAAATGGGSSGGAGASDGGASGGAAAGGTGGITNNTGGVPAAGGAPGDGGAPAAGGMPATGGTGSGGDAGSGGDTGSGGGGQTALLFTTDFESDAAGAVMNGGAPWTTSLPTEYDSGGVVEVTASVAAHSGSQSVYVKKGNDGQAFLQMQGAPVFPFTGDKIHVRAYIRLSEWPTSHAAWMEVGAVTNEENELRWGAHQGVLQVNHWPGDQDQIAEGVSLSVDEWHCIEYSYEPATLTMEVYLEGTKVDDLTVVGTFARGGDFTTVPIDAIRFGAEINTSEAWFDDIAVSDSFIGCL